MTATTFQLKTDCVQGVDSTPNETKHLSARHEIQRKIHWKLQDTVQQGEPTSHARLKHMVFRHVKQKIRDTHISVPATKTSLCKEHHHAKTKATAQIPAKTYILGIVLNGPRKINVRERDSCSFNHDSFTRKGKCKDAVLQKSVGTEMEMPNGKDPTGINLSGKSNKSARCHEKKADNNSTCDCWHPPERSHHKSKQNQ